MPQPDLGAAYANLEKLAYVAEGGLAKSKSVIYAFVDANCPYCHLMWQAVQPYQAVGLQVRWIPVAVLGPTSMPKAIAILAARDKLAAFRQMEENHGEPWTAAANADQASRPAIVEAVVMNGKAMDAFGIGGTPGIVWRDKLGKIRTCSGMPRLADPPSVTGLPEQANTNPALDKFR